MTLFIAALAAFAMVTRWLVVKSQRRSPVYRDLLAARTYHARLWTIRARLKGVIKLKPKINISDKISVIVIVGSALGFINPLAGIAFGVTVTVVYVQNRRARTAEAQRIAQRGDPTHQATMRGNGDDGGLSIEEANAYRRKAHGR